MAKLVEQTAYDDLIVQAKSQAGALAQVYELYYDRIYRFCVHRLYNKTTAEDITKTMAVCMVCGASANKTQRLIESDERIVVGAGETYEPRCRKCYRPPVSG